KDPPPVKVTVDLDGLSQRILALPPKPAGYSGLQVGNTGQLFYRKEPGAQRGGDATLDRYDLEKRKEDSLAEGVSAFEVSRDGKRALGKVKEARSICDVADKRDPAKQKLATDAGQAKLDPPAEWTQICEHSRPHDRSPH